MCGAPPGSRGRTRVLGGRCDCQHQPGFPVTGPQQPLGDGIPENGHGEPQGPQSFPYGPVLWLLPVTLFLLGLWLLHKETLTLPFSLLPRPPASLSDRSRPGCARLTNPRAFLCHSGERPCLALSAETVQKVQNSWTARRSHFLTPVGVCAGPTPPPSLDPPADKDGRWAGPRRENRSASSEQTRIWARGPSVDGVCARVPCTPESASRM